MSQITRVARSKKIKKLAISSFKKGQILKNLKGPIYYFCQHSKKAKNGQMAKWPNGQMAKWPNHFISGKQFKKAKFG